MNSSERAGQHEFEYWATNARIRDTAFSMRSGIWRTFLQMLLLSATLVSMTKKIAREHAANDCVMGAPDRCPRGPPGKSPATRSRQVVKPLHWVLCCPGHSRISHLHNNMFVFLTFPPSRHGCPYACFLADKGLNSSQKATKLPLSTVLRLTQFPPFGPHTQEQPSLTDRGPLLWSRNCRPGRRYEPS